MRGVRGQKQSRCPLTRALLLTLCAPPSADEYGTVTRVSQSGGAVVATNWASNLDVFSNFDIPAFSQKPAPSPSPVPAQVHTACRECRGACGALASRAPTHPLLQCS